jgi:hypothetical protein
MVLGNIFGLMIDVNVKIYEKEVVAQITRLEYI